MNQYTCVYPLGAYFGKEIALSVMDDFGNLVPLGHAEGSPLRQWEPTLANGSE